MMKMTLELAFFFCYQQIFQTQNEWDVNFKVQLYKINICSEVGKQTSSVDMSKNKRLVHNMIR